MKALIKSSFFSGVKWEDHSKINSWDIKNADRIHRGENKTSCYKEFDNMKSKIIKISDIYEFYDLVRFFYKNGYCCTINKKDIEIL
jgi:hypothetical protein